MEASRRRSLVGNNRKSKRSLAEMNKDNDGDMATDEEELVDAEVWDTLSNGFKRAQHVLDKNRDLIERVNDNHRSRIPDNVARNVGLINEINGNISRVMEIYSDLAVDFTKQFHERRMSTAKNGDTATTTTTTGSYGGSCRSSAQKMTSKFDC